MREARPRPLQLVLATALVGVLAALAIPNAQVRAITAPLWTKAYYEQQVTTSTYYAQGCALGDQALHNQIPQVVLTILDLGRAKTQGGLYGTSHFVVGAFASTATIANAVVEFAHGFYICTYTNLTAHLRIAVGTNNNLLDGELTDAQTTAHGQAWSAMVTSINNTLRAGPYASQVDVAGATDLEPSWSTYANAKRWIDGYASSYQWALYNFGSADGCPSSGTQTATARACNNGWTQSGVWYVSYGAPPAYAVPEIYATTGVNASQWYYISKYAKLAHTFCITFSGELTQSGACAQRGGCTGTNNTPSQGYTQLWNKINSDTATASGIQWSVDIKWDS